MLYVDIPTQSELLALAIERTPASVSIYLPTTPVSGEISGDRTVLKNLAKEALAQLAEAGHDKREISAIADHFEDLADDEEFLALPGAQPGRFRDAHTSRRSGSRTRSVRWWKLRIGSISSRC